MKNFLAVFLGTPEAAERSGWNALSEAVQQERTSAGIQAWHAWMTTNAARIVESGAPVGKTKRVSASGLNDVNNAICGYVVVRAETHEAAAKLFINHPHFAIFPGESVEIMECLPTPGMA